MVFVEQQWRFPKPVYVGDKIRARGHGDLGAREQADGDPRYRDH